MTGACKLCREIVMAPPVFEVGPDRAKLEFLQFAEEMRRHVASRHLGTVKVYGNLLTVAAQFFSALFADCQTEDYTAGCEAIREFLAASIRDAKVQIVPAAPQPDAGVGA